VGAAVTSGMVDDGTAESAPSRRTCKRRYPGPVSRQYEDFRRQ